MSPSRLRQHALYRVGLLSERESISRRRLTYLPPPPPVPLLPESPPPVPLAPDAPPVPVDPVVPAVPELVLPPVPTP